MEIPSRIRGFATIFTAAGIAFASATAAAQAYPSNPIEMLISSTFKGDVTEQVARLVADVSQKENLLAQPLQVKLHSGRNGTAGFRYVASRRGDPHTVLTVLTVRFFDFAAQTKGARALDDYTPLALFGSAPQAIVVSAESKFASFKDLLEAARREPGSITCATQQILSAGLELYL